MDARRFDSLAKNLTTETPRRRVLLGVGGLALGSLGLVAGTRDAAASCRRRCRRRCENRGPKCQHRCKDRLCD